jgi:hypothetical protein
LIINKLKPSWQEVAEEAKAAEGTLHPFFEMESLLF